MILYMYTIVILVHQYMDRLFVFKVLEYIRTKFGLAKKGKKKSKLEKLLLIDHSEVYFENGKLDEELSENKKNIDDEKARQLLLLDGEILELWKYLETLDALKQTSEEERKHRPQSTGTIRRRPRRAPGTAPPRLRTKSRLQAHFEKDPDSSDREIGHSKGPFSQKGLQDQQTRSDTGPFNRSNNIFQNRGFQRQGEIHIPTSSVGIQEKSRPATAVRKPKLSKEKRLQKQLEEATLKINLNKFPKAWYTSALPASDAVLARTRRQEEDPTYDPELKIWAAFILKIKQKRPDIFKKVNRMREKSVTTPDAKHDSDDDEQEVGLKMLCDKKVKPVVMSLRKLKELAHIDSLSDRVKNKKLEKQRKMIEDLKKYSDSLQVDVQQFVADVKFKVEQDLRDCEEKEPETEENPGDFDPLAAAIQ
ncbi:hypothetical protein KUTeg_006851 [Tegillarca granosa]|uniref:Uncharacterized protein n=1 Tax=Tegillarca granosa TaxID=220873 RepID=A0ABQ9FDI1_TEGGR|nr:hypothetical protein KUTeg_006851 [Tegillarca granosa]